MEAVSVSCQVNKDKTEEIALFWANAVYVQLRLKLGGGQEYDRLSVLTAVAA
jgi:hypothetical protein